MTLVVTNTTNLELALQPDSNFWQDSARTTSASATDPVGAWDDQSGNSNHATQGTTANKPTLQSGYVFNDQGDGLEQNDVADFLSDAKSFSIYMVIDPKNLGAGDRLIDFQNASNTEYIHVYPVSGAGSQIIVKINGSSNVATSGGSLATGKQVYSIIGDGTDIKVYFNGTLQVTRAYPATAPASLTKAFFLNSSFYGQAWESDIYAIYLYSAAHNDTDRGTIEDELTAAYLSAGSQTSNLDEVLETPTIDTISTVLGSNTVNLDDVIEAPVLDDIASIIGEVISNTEGLIEAPVLDSIASIIGSVTSNINGVTESPSYDTIIVTNVPVGAQTSNIDEVLEAPVYGDITSLIGSIVSNLEGLSETEIFDSITTSYAYVSNADGFTHTPVYGGLSTILGENYSNLDGYESTVVYGSIASGVLGYADGTIALVFPSTGTLVIVFPSSGSLEVLP